MFNSQYSNRQPNYNHYAGKNPRYFDPNYHYNDVPLFVVFPTRPHLAPFADFSCPPPPLIRPSHFNGTYQTPKVPRYNNNEQANVQQLSIPSTSSVTISHHEPHKVNELHFQYKNQPSNHKIPTASMEKVQTVPQKSTVLNGSIGTKIQVNVNANAQPPKDTKSVNSNANSNKSSNDVQSQSKFNLKVESDHFMAILKQLISPDGLNLVDTLWVLKIRKLVAIITNVNDDQKFYENIRENCSNKKMDRFKMLQIWAAMFLIRPELCLNNKSNIVLRICLSHVQSIASSKLSKKIREYLTIQALLNSLLPPNIITFIPSNYNLSRPYAKRIQKELKTFYDDYDLNKKPDIYVIRLEAGLFKSNMTNGIERLLDLFKSLILTREINKEMQTYSKIESIMRDFSETSDSRFEFVDCLLSEWFELPKDVFENILVLKRKFWTVCTILNCSDIKGRNSQNSRDNLPESTLNALNKLFKDIFDWNMLKDFFEFVAIRQHLGLNRSHQMSQIDTFMDKNCGIEYCWGPCVNNMPMKSRIDFAFILPDKNPRLSHKTQSQPVSKPKDLIDLTKNNDYLSKHSKKNDEAGVVKVNEFMSILNSLIKPYAVNREDKLWKDKISVFRSIIIYPKNQSSFIHELRNRCRNCKLDRIAMLRIWIELFSTNFNVLLEGNTHTEEVVLKILARAYLNAVDETGRKRLGELIIIRKHLMGSLPSEALSKGDIDLISKPYVQRLMADNPDLIFKSKNGKADKILKTINPSKKTLPVSTLPITELLKQNVTKSVPAIGIDKLLHEAKFLFKTKKNDIINQMKSFAKIVRIAKEHCSIYKDSNFEFIDCLLTEPFRKKKGTLQGRLLLWAVCAILNCAHIPNKKYDLPEPTVVYLSRHFKSSLVEKKYRLEFVAIRQHLGRGRSHQMSKIDIYADEMCRSKFNWRNRVETSRRMSREDFVTPEENLKCHPKLAYTFHVNNDDSRKTSKQIESNDDSAVNDSDCESETSSVEILSDVEKPPAPIVDIFSSDEEDDEVISKPFEKETVLETEAGNLSSSNQTNNAILNQDNVSNANSSSEEQQNSTNASYESNDLNQLNQQIQDNISIALSNEDQSGTIVHHTSNGEQIQNDDTDDFNNIRGQKKVLHEPSCKLNRSCKQSKSRIKCQSRCAKTTTASTSKITSSTKKYIECTCSVEFIKANRPTTSVSDNINKPEVNVVDKVSAIVDETAFNDLPTIIGIPYEILNAEQFVNYIWDNNLVKLVEEPVALQIEKEVANLLTLPFVPIS